MKQGEWVMPANSQRVWNGLRDIFDRRRELGLFPRIFKNRNQGSSARDLSANLDDFSDQPIFLVFNHPTIVRKCPDPQTAILALKSF
jgi:hypothetical protein